MSSPEVEKFEVTDYDYENEFNINRPQRRQTKSQAIYGSFGIDGDSDDEWDTRPGLGGGGKKSYSAGINFISGGLKKSAEDEAAETSKNEEGKENEDDLDPLLQTQFGKPKSAKQRRGYKFADQARPGQKGIGDWEKHTNMIGSKLMMKMGYKPGEGLGKDGKGIATPVEAKLRLGKGAIGYYGTERTERSLKDFPVQDADADEEKKFKEELSKWKRSDTGKKKTTYVYKTADELIAKGSKRKVKETGKSKHSQVKVIDMTGREQRVLSGYHAISTRKHDSDTEEEEVHTSADERKAFEMPELLHNLNMLIDRTEEEIITKDRQLRYERDMTVNMQHESDRLKTLCQQEEQQISRLTQVLNLINTFDERTQPSSAEPLTLEECADLFSRLQDDYYEEYRAYDLVTLSIAVVLPLVKKYFIGWQPLSNPRFGVQVMTRWKGLLDVDRCQGDSTAQNNAYSKLIWEIWMPILRTAINQWNTRNPDSLLEVLEVWMPLLPPWMFQNILDQLINPKLQIEVDKWNPLTDTMPIHAWLHPWLPLMGSRLEPLWAPIRHRLASALSKWHPSDISAMIMLKPWSRVFSQGHMDAFLAKNIIPKLASCLQEMVINPANQVMDNWKWVMSWQQLLPDQTLVNLLDRCFFPRWLHTLANWLNTAPNYDEVGVWYKGWKSVLPERLITHPTIKDWLSKALNTMNSAVSNPGVPVRLPAHPPPPPPIPGQIPTILSSIYGNNIPDYSNVATPPPPPQVPESKKKAPNEPIAPPLSGTGSVLHSFKDLVAMKAAEANLEFYPIPGKTHEARQVYQCGSVHVSIDRGVIFMQDGVAWCPLSLSQLLHRASN
ncbi:tuftelin-interacting protein 11-like [Watersipora subatra]|uniref:tuftelin-interacting protein 11-like n=1 Tax=Watersipora subatra TaxID=2589382 RepID=UPI00355B262F